MQIEHDRSGFLRGMRGRAGRGSSEREGEGNAISVIMAFETKITISSENRSIQFLNLHFSK